MKDELLTRLQNGDETAFTDIYNKYAKFMLLEASIIIGPHNAKDAVQEIFTVWWKNRFLHRLDLKKCNLKTYIDRCIHNYCYKFLDDKRKIFLSESKDELDPNAFYETPEINIDLSKLSGKPLEIITRFFIKDEPKEEIIKNLKINSKTFRNHLYNGLTILRNNLVFENCIK